MCNEEIEKDWLRWLKVFSENMKFAKNTLTKIVANSAINTQYLFVQV